MIKKIRKNMKNFFRSIFSLEVRVPVWIFVAVFYILTVLIFSFSTEPDYYYILGSALLIGTIFVLLGLFIHQFLPAAGKSADKIVLLGILGIILLAGVRTFRHSSEWTLSGYIYPLAMVSMLVAVLIEARLAIIYSFFLSFLVSGLYRFDFALFFILALSGLVGVFCVRRVKNRTDLIKASLIISAVNILSLLVIIPLISGKMPSSVQKKLIEVVVNGFLSGILTIGLLPYLESAFQITTDIKLLELGDFNHPLLKRLANDVPGTFQHSLIMATLAEMAALSIGANPILARVGAYYHDVGKLVKSEYFIENQKGESPHDNLSPEQSSNIISAHVWEGVKIGREYELPQDLVNFIGQHHGRNLIRFFYKKALDRRGEVDKEKFRYPGPYPQTREIGIVMLADAVEASSRVLEDHSPAKIKDTVHRVIDGLFIDGQMDECELTLRDVHRISESFITVLGGRFHSRIEYPEIEKGEREKILK